MRGVSKRAKGNSSRDTGTSGDTVYLLVEWHTAVSSTVGHGLRSSGMRLQLTEAP